MLTTLPLLLPLAFLAPRTPHAPVPPVELREGAVRLPHERALHWLEAGAEEGEAVLFLHGYTDTARSFLPLMEAVAALRPDLRLVALDLRGHGGSSLPPLAETDGALQRSFALEALAEDALAVLKARGVPRAHVVGHSLGSAVAQVLALAHPERVERLVLVATSACFAANPVALELIGDGFLGRWRSLAEARALAWPRDVWSLSPPALDREAESLLRASWVLEPGTDPAFLAVVLPETVRTPLGTWIGAFGALGAHDLRERLADLRAPTLVLWPVQDAFFPEEPDQRELRRALARAHERHGTPWWWKRYGREPQAPGAAQTDLGHNLHWAAPEAVARDLAAFLRPGGAPTAELVVLEGEPPRVRSEPRGALVLHAEGARAPERR